MNTNKKIILASAITLATMNTNALPFAPTDARAMAMGGTGVSSSEVASTVQFNPALLANTRSDDHFGLKIPQAGVSIADDGGFIDEVEDFDERSPNAKPNSDSTNIDLLDETLTSATGPLGLEKLTQALDEMSNPATPADFTNAKQKLAASVDHLDGLLFSSTTAAPALVTHSNAVADDMDDLNGKSLRLNLGANIALAVPSKSFSMALSTAGGAVFSGRVIINSQDTDILRNYSAATAAYLGKVSELETAINAVTPNTLPTTEQQIDIDAKKQAVEQFSYNGEDGTPIFTGGELVADDADFKSQVQVVGVGTTELGLTASRVFKIQGHDIAFGLTPKLQKVTIFDYTQDLDGEECTDNNGDGDTRDPGECVEVSFDSDAITDSTEEYNSFNLDIGTAYQFGAENQFQAGLVIKNLIPKEYESSPYVLSNGAQGTLVKMNPMVRAGISHKTSWSKVAFDLDLTKNDPVAFEDSTQYAAIGAELDLFRFAQLRAGYRANLAASDQDVMTFGIGLSPFAVHLDIGLMANPSDVEKEAGVAVEFGVEF
jgi:hypothetical protein